MHPNIHHAKATRRVSLLIARDDEAEQGMWQVDDAARQRWEREQAFLGLARDTPNEVFARGGLGSLAGDPTVRIVVLPGDPAAQAVPAEAPENVVPIQITLPGDVPPLPCAFEVRGTSSGYVALKASTQAGWERFHAVCWHGGVDFFLGKEGAQSWNLGPGYGGRVILLQRVVRWAWGAFDLQRQIVERYEVVGPFRAIVGIAGTDKAALANLGAGWPEPGSEFGWGGPIAIEPQALLAEDLDTWPDEKGCEELALRFGARIDLVFGGTGTRHLDR